jgi:hypothetical protein
MKRLWYKLKSMFKKEKNKDEMVIVWRVSYQGKFQNLTNTNFF